MRRIAQQPPPLNQHGDRLTPTTGRHGADIASQRIDDLDRRALAHVLNLPTSGSTCVDLGCGFGWQGARFAMLGARTHLYDLLPESESIRLLRTEAALPMTYVNGDLRKLDAKSLPRRISVAFSQRFIHYLRFTEAQSLIRLIAARQRSGDSFFISASGIDSELGQGYDRSSLDHRYAPLSEGMRRKHGISQSVCLYSEAELSQLMESCGYAAVSVWRSEFGNIKGVFRR